MATMINPTSAPMPKPSGWGGAVVVVVVVDVGIDNTNIDSGLAIEGYDKSIPEPSRPVKNFCVLSEERLKDFASRKVGLH